MEEVDVNNVTVAKHDLPPNGYNISTVPNSLDQTITFITTLVCLFQKHKTTFHYLLLFRRALTLPLSISCLDRRKI